MKRFVFGALICLLGQGALAQEFNCGDPQHQKEMNYCAYLDYQIADAELNAVWGEVVAHLSKIDPQILRALRDAQRAWIPYRNQACVAEGMSFHGGSMEQYLVHSCRTVLTQRRTEDLKFFLAL